MEYDPYDEGYDAYNEGRSRRDNPYGPRAYDDAEEWDLGWVAAREDDLSGPAE